jgi:hypothetical protein
VDRNQLKRREFITLLGGAAMQQPRRPASWAWSRAWSKSKAILQPAMKWAKHPNLRAQAAPQGRLSVNL